MLLSHIAFIIFLGELEECIQHREDKNVYVLEQRAELGKLLNYLPSSCLFMEEESNNTELCLRVQTPTY